MYGDSVNWREAVVRELAEAGIKGLSPMRGKEYLAGITIPLGPDGDKYSIMGPLSTNHGITTRDRWDTMRCDLVLANFAGAKQVSIGTCIELGWADAARVPVVGVLEPGNLHEHGMVLETMGFRVHTLEQAVTLVKAILR